MAKPVLVEINWWDHPRIQKVDKFVEEWFDKGSFKSFMDATAKATLSIQDYRHNALRWIEDHRESLDELEKKVKALPLDPRETMTIEKEKLDSPSTNPLIAPRDG